jgi:hypothetical protein
MANDEQLIRVTTEPMVNFDRIPPGGLPKLVRSTLDGVCMWEVNGCVVWLRDDQLEEIASLFELAIRERNERFANEGQRP